VANFGRRAVDVGHRDHDPEHRRDDPESGQGVCRFLQRVHRRVVLFGHDAKFRIQHLADLFRLNRGIHQRTHAAADEVQQMMIVLNQRILRKNAALFRLRNVRLERDGAGHTSI
jgi:hypothetical protein